MPGPGDRDRIRHFVSNLGNRIGMNLSPHPDISLHNYENEFVAIIELPGLKSSDIDINVFDDNKIYISAWKPATRKQFRRTLRLPEPVADANAEANYEDGILTIRLPKVRSQIETDEPIDMESGSESEIEMGEPLVFRDHEAGVVQFIIALALLGSFLISPIFAVPLFLQVAGAVILALVVIFRLTTVKWHQPVEV